MHTTSLRKVGGSVMLAADGLLLVDPKPKQHYTLQELLAKSDFSETQAPEERVWVDAPPVGGELI